MRKVIPYNPKLKLLARKLRSNSTSGEVKLWKWLKGKQMFGFDFHRQRPIDNFIVDFMCQELGLVIELDGSSHDEKKYEYDKYREQVLTDLGLTVLRFTEYEVRTRIDDVITTIELWISEHTP